MTTAGAVVGRANMLNARILIADDSAANVKLLARILRAAGYTAVESTTDPRAVCTLYRERRHDLILLDLLMPGMDGFEVMQRLTEIETEGYLPVLVLTAQPNHKHRALKAGAKDFITKPFDQVEVLTRIHNMLEVRLLLRESRTYARWLEEHDPITRLPNRAKFADLVARALARPGRSDKLSVHSVGIDRFQNVSDAVGRSNGDQLIRLAGERLTACVGPADTVARLEDDVFGLIISSPDGESDAMAIARAIRDSMHQPFRIDGRELTMTTSVGIALAPADSVEAAQLMRFSETALHNAQAAGGHAHHFYADAMNARALEALDLEVALSNAIARDEFELHYQPKIRLVTGEWSGVEALLRWNRPGHGLTLPSSFIAVLEETGLILPVGAWVIDAACRQVADWARAGLGSIRVAVNVSGKQFLGEGFVSDCARAIRDNSITPDLLHIEITESSLMSRLAETDEVLRALQALGIRIAIDDFGTGYSSLAYLRRFPIDALKIDISFIRDVTTSQQGAAITAAIINLARSLRMTVIAEGVETEPQLEFLRSHACDEIQGYYCSRPLPAHELTALRTSWVATERQQANGQLTFG